MKQVSASRRAVGHRSRLPWALSWLFIAVMYIACICGGRAALGQQDVPPVRLLEPDAAQLGDGRDALRATPTTLRRLVRRFGFEESELRPLDMPINFYRYDAPDQGFPPFGEMSPSDEHAVDGNWSFRFELDGGSMAARIPTGVLPVVPYGHYVVSVDVRTEDLQHSAARMLAWLTDSAGSVLPASIARSQPARSNGRWTTLTVELDAETPNATDLVIELQLVQPREYRRDQSLIAPAAEDINGRAWFDNLMIWHAPIIELSTDRPGNIIMPEETSQLVFTVRDLSSEPMSAVLRVFDIEGSTAFERTFDQHFNLGTQRTVQLGDLPAGWYRAVLDLQNPQRTVGRQWLDFVVLAPLRADVHAERPAQTFGIEITPDVVANGGDALPIIERCATNTVLVPIWPKQVNGASDASLQEAMLRLATELARRDRHIIAALDELPVQVAESMNVERTQVLEAIGGDASKWQPYLDHAILNLGLDVHQWRIGAANWSYDLAELQPNIDAATRSLSSFVSNPVIALKWSPQRLPNSENLPAYWLDLQREFRPPQLETLLEPWIGRNAHLVAHLHTHPDDNYAPLERSIDLAHRALFTWKAGLDTIMIDAPWQSDQSLQHRVMPSPLLVVWRNLADQLTGRKYLARLDAPGAQHCWILDSDTREPAIVAWSGRTSGAPAALDLVLAETPVDVIDMFGNRRTVQPGPEGRHFIELREAPLFIEGIDPQLAVFRSGFRVHPNVIPSVHRLHEIELELQNPWTTTINGTLRLRPNSEWQVNPRVSEFVIEPNGSVRLPVEFIMDRNILSGPKLFDAEVTIVSERRYDIHITAGFHVGLNDIQVSASWSRADDSDAITITQYVTNNGDEPVTISAFMHAPGFGPRLRPIGQLAPGATAVQTFHYPGGAIALPGRSVRYGVKESDGSTRVNRVLEIPDANGTPSRAATADQSPQP